MKYNNKNKEFELISKLQEENDTSPCHKARELLIINESGSGINFVKTNELAVDCSEEILQNWLPDGEQRGRQYVALNPTRPDGKAGSFQINTETGVWKDFASEDSGGDFTSLIAYLEGNITQKAAAIKILRFIAEIDPANSVEIAQRATKQKAIAKPKYSPIFPVPKNAKEPPKFFGKLGSPTFTWKYCNENGELLCLVYRFDTTTGKIYLPATWCRDESGWEFWHSFAPPAPKPIYRLEHLSKRKDAIVLFTEGEKAAEAAQRLFPDFVAVTTMGGAQAAEKADLSPLAGRTVYIARDNDSAGLAYQEKLIELLRSVNANVRATLRIEALAKSTALLPKGYDLADAEADGWDKVTLAEIGESLWCEVVQIDHLPVTSQAKNETKSNLTNKSAGDLVKVPAQEHAKTFLRIYDDKVMTINGQILAYKNGYWHPLNSEVDVKKPLIDIMGVWASATQIKGVYELIKYKTAEPSEKMERKTSLICLKNGTLDPLKKELLAHSPDHYLKNQVNIEYQPSATCPIWLKTLNEIFGVDTDCQEKIQLIQEFMGYCLIPDTRHAKFVWMVGAGGNGKSLILAIFTALIGKDNISYAQIERLEKAPVRAELLGKLLNISSEMSADATLSDSYLKQIVAGETIEADPKFERSFSFKPTARIIAATNSLPRLLDHSDGFARRAVILRFNRQFSETEKDINLESKLMAELPGILNWALEGLSNLEERRRFVLPKSSNEELKQYRLKSDPVKLFAEEHLTVTEERASWVGCSALYLKYKEWCSINGHRILSSSQFGDGLEALRFRKVRSSHGRDWTAKYDEKQFLSSGRTAKLTVHPTEEARNGLATAYKV